jgi:hypothetical protein
MLFVLSYKMNYISIRNDKRKKDTHLQHTDHTRKLPHKLHVPIIIKSSSTESTVARSSDGGGVPRRIVLVDEVVPSNGHT